MNEVAAATAAFSMGLVGNVHCLGMCGGIAAAIGIAHDEHRLVTVLLFNSGRVLTYSLLGAVVGAFGYGAVQALPGIGPALRMGAGLLLIAMGLYINQWWLGLSALERLGSKLWQPIKPIFVKRTARSGYANKLILGLLWGFLPCGLVYSALGWSLVTADPLQAALLMACFGLGTLPAMVVSGVTGNAVMQILRQRGIRLLIGGLLIGFGVWTTTAPLRQHTGGHLMLPTHENTIQKTHDSINR